MGIIDHSEFGDSLYCVVLTVHIFPAMVLDTAVINFKEQYFA